jgi:predicted nuclease of predicted toxin-antitoxin system
MPWRPLDSPSQLGSEFRRKTRFLVDEDVGIEIAQYLRSRRHYNTTFVGGVGLAGRDDTDLYAYAWREMRVLLTHDRDFLDDKKFPEYCNPGVVVLPGGGGDQKALAVGLAIALRVFGTAAALWRKTKSTISASGRVDEEVAHPHPSQTRMCRFPASGSSWKSLAHGGADDTIRDSPAKNDAR